MDSGELLPRDIRDQREMILQELRDTLSNWKAGYTAMVEDGGKEADFLARPIERVLETLDELNKEQA